MGCGLSKAHSTRRFSCPTVMPALTVHGRLLIVQRHQAGWPQAHIAAAMGVSRKCVKTWIDRYAAEGEAGSARPVLAPAHDARRGPARRSSSGSSSCARRERRGPDWIGAELGVPARTVSRVLARHGVPRLATLDPITGEVIRASQGHRGPLRTRAARRAGPHGREEARPDPRRRRLAGPRPRRPAAIRATAATRSGSTTSTPWSTTTPGWPTPRSCPTRRAPPARRSWSAPSPTSPPTASPGSSG